MRVNEWKEEVERRGECISLANALRKECSGEESAKNNRAIITSPLVLECSAKINFSFGKKLFIIKEMF